MGVVTDSGLTDNPYSARFDKILADSFKLDTQTLAILAVAYEQRTANLLKLIELDSNDGDSYARKRQAIAIIATRLGLDKVNLR